MCRRFRLERFRDCLDNGENIGTVQVTNAGMIVGTSTKLEKPYLRLTAAANSWNIRPLKILKLALENVITKYMENSNNYEFACEQLKSIRQDLVVQGINNRFAAHEYETHARMALESGDLEEFNQCQSRILEFMIFNFQSLKTISRNTTNGTVSNTHNVIIPISYDEIVGYKILYSLIQQNQCELICTLRNLHASNVTKLYENGPIINYGCSILKALRHGNYIRFMKLYKRAPLMTG